MHGVCQFPVAEHDGVKIVVLIGAPDIDQFCITEPKRTAPSGFDQIT